MKTFVSRMGKKLLMTATLFPILTFAASQPSSHTSLAPQPTACIESTFSATGDNYWKTITLTVTNQCGTTIDFQNATITFQNTIPLNTNFWGNFDPLSYPDNNLQITSQGSDKNYLATLSLHFPSEPWANSKLPANRSFQIKYGAASDGHVGSANVYLNGGPVQTGSIQLKNDSAKPSDVVQPYALVHVIANGINISNVQLPWSGTQTVSGLAPGNYSITADNVSGSNNTYKGSAAPATVSVIENQTATSTITYAVIQQNGQLAIQLQTLPSELAGYTGKPVVEVIQSDTGSSVQSNLNWGTTTTVSQLKNGSTYNFSTPVITYNNYHCEPQFAPGSVMASSTSVPTTSLTYRCSQVAQSSVTLNVKGAPTTLSSLQVTLTPNNTTTPITQTIPLTNGSGSKAVSLTTGTIYTVSANAVQGYTIKFDPQPLTVENGAIENITLTADSSDTPVSRNGQLHVCGTQICNEQNQPIQLKGMSSHGIQWYGWQGSNTGKACLTTASLDTLVNTWKASVMRISMYVQEGGYETNPTAFTNQVNALIDEATKRGIYAIVDWHILSPGDPNVNLSKAKTFFTAIASAHKNNNNLFYEIANEPNGVPWSSIKSYADALIPVIRAIDNKTIILVGTPGWSSLGVSDGRSSQDIISNPLNYPNIMYTFHFYAASHRDNYLNEVDKASNTLPIFVTEFGTQTYSGGGANDFAMSDRYLQLFAQKKISWTNWNYSDDSLSGAVWNPGTCSNGPWVDSNLKPAGTYIKSKIQN
ncbi:chitinase [Legionella wadsworthii]|uniref:Chitinase n=1 Tax=Legionella wadsworthii TaxID=28088 RepID=A0A378LRY8_9GAMM|nr:glycoside hydrolase family 5 protein [Legionella wadsworthii]STY29504.1 chitinase [Legionella wadsworthii]